MAGSTDAIVAALGFGSMYSGYAFSSQSDFEKDPLKINLNEVWESGNESLTSLKTPTCLLLDKSTKIIAFGYEAENIYNGYPYYHDGEEQADNYFFNNFHWGYFNSEVTRLCVAILHFQSMSNLILLICFLSRVNL